LQGVKRGIVELADLVVVNKADGALADLARHTAADYAHALHFVGPARVLLASALEGTGIVDVWSAVIEDVDAARAAGALDGKRPERAKAWMWSEVIDTLVDELRADPALRAHLVALEEDVAAGRCAPAAAAGQVMAAFRKEAQRDRGDA